MTSADPASLADAARILRRLADDFAESTEALRPASRGAIRSGASAGTRADLRRITAACEATAAAVRDGGAALHHAAYAAADQNAAVANR